jgi:hypothetical protein
LGHDKRRVLRVRCRSDQLHRRESGRGKQQETDVYHEVWISEIRDNRLAINE